MLSASHTNKRKVSRRLCPEHNSYSLFYKLLAGFSQPWDLALDLFAGTFAAAMACFTALCQRTFVGCEGDPKCFHPAKQVLLMELAIAAFDAGRVVSLSGERGEAAKAVADTVPEDAVADPLQSPANIMSVFSSSVPCVLAFLGLLWHIAELTGTHLTCPVHCWTEEYFS